MELADIRMQLGNCLLWQGKYAEAEPWLRQCLPVFEREQSGHASHYNAHALLGWALFGQKKYEEAEPLLLKAYDGLKKPNSERTSASPAQLLKDTAERLGQLYEAWGKPEQAANRAANSGKG